MRYIKHSDFAVQRDGEGAHFDEQTKTHLNDDDDGVDGRMFEIIGRNWLQIPVL